MVMVTAMWSLRRDGVAIVATSQSVSHLQDVTAVHHISQHPADPMTPHVTLSHDLKCFVEC